MANEIRVQAGIFVKNGNLEFQSRPGTFQADMDGSYGQSPGLIEVSEDGTDIDFSELGDPGYCWFHNPHASVTVQVGVWDDTANVFFPVFRVGPGKSAVMELDADLGEEYSGTGTGTSANLTTFRAKGVGAAGRLIVMAFER